MTVQVCSRCIIDETVPQALFKPDGTCSYCTQHDLLAADFPNGEEGRRRLEATAERIRADGKGRDYDCVVGVSGGRDSTYLLYLTKKILGLRPLAVHFNDGFGNPVAGQNIQRSTDILDVPLITVTSDWRESKDLRIACLKASVPDLNLGSDVGIATALFGTACKEGLRHVVIGQSFRTEGIAPLQWNYLDGRYLRAIHDQFGTVPLRPWTPEEPGYHLGAKELFYYTVMKRIRTHMPFYNWDYVRADVDDFLKEELSWVYPGAHYFDDLYQALMQRVLRVKFGIDRRQFNYAALVRSGQMDRDEALAALKEIYVIEDEKVIDLCIKRLGLKRTEFEALLDRPPKTFVDYPNSFVLIRRMKPVIGVLSRLGLIPRSSYFKYCGEMAHAL